MRTWRPRPGQQALQRPMILPGWPCEQERGARSDGRTSSSCSFVDSAAHVGSCACWIGLMQCTSSPPALMSQVPAEPHGQSGAQRLQGPASYRPNRSTMCFLAARSRADSCFPRPVHVNTGLLWLLISLGCVRAGSLWDQATERSPR